MDNSGITNIKDLCYSINFIRGTQWSLNNCYDPYWQPGLFAIDVSGDAVQSYLKNPTNSLQMVINKVNSVLKEFQLYRLKNKNNPDDIIAKSYESIFNDCFDTWETMLFLLSQKKLKLGSTTNILKTFFNTHKELTNQYFGFEFKTEPWNDFARMITVGRNIIAHTHGGFEKLPDHFKFTMSRGVFLLDIERQNRTIPSQHLYIYLFKTMNEEWFSIMLKEFKKHIQTIIKQIEQEN